MPIPTESLLEKARLVIDIECRQLEKLRHSLDDSFTRAVELIAQRLEARGKIVVMGVGKSGHIGEKIAATLTSTGSPAIMLNSLNALHGDLGMVADGDVILAMSYSGETEELNNIIPALGRFDVKVIAMTGNPGSFLAQSADVHLNAHVDEEACPLKLAPTSSTTAMLVLGDALAMVLLEMRGFKPEDFAKFHPGGRLGRSLLIKVSHIMRTGEHVAVVPDDSTVTDTLKEMTRRRCGAAAVIDAGGRLAGIFTHGDFARHFTANPGLGQDPVSNFMTRNPITIASDRLAVEVLHILETHRIDDLLVLDRNQAPIGIIDSQDLARHKLV